MWILPKNLEEFSEILVKILGKLRRNVQKNFFNFKKNLEASSHKFRKILKKFGNFKKVWKKFGKNQKKFRKN